MKFLSNIIKKLLFLLGVILAHNANAQTGIGTTTPNASAKLEVYSTNKGFLAPRVTLTGNNDVSTIAAPAIGLLVYNTATAGSSPNNVNPGFYYYNGSAWVRLTVPSDNALNVTGIVAVANGGTGVTASTGSGNTVLSNSPSLETPTIYSGNGQYPASINILPSTHASSRRASVWVGDWGVLQDLNGVGTKNFSITQNLSGTYPTRFLINTDGKIGLGSTSPTTALHIENGNSIGTGDPGNNSVPSIYVYNNNNTSSTANSIVAIRSGGTGGGKPYLSMDASSFAGYSIGMNNPTDQLIINTDWNFNTGNATKNAVIINETGQSRVIIPYSAGGYANDWPSGWGGGLATYDITCSGIYYQNLTARSDKRLKNSIYSLEEAMVKKYLGLRPVSYFWNKGQTGEDKIQYGLIAQEVENIFPELVSTATDSLQTKSINYQALHALSLKVIQSQQAEIQDLKRRHELFEARLLKLEATLNK